MAEKITTLEDIVRDPRVQAVSWESNGFDEGFDIALHEDLAYTSHFCEPTRQMLFTDLADAYPIFNEETLHCSINEVVFEEEEIIEYEEMMLEMEVEEEPELNDYGFYMLGLPTYEAE